MTKLHPGMSKPSSVTLVVIKTLYYLFLNWVIFLTWFEYFY